MPDVVVLTPKNVQARLLPGLASIPALQPGAHHLGLLPEASPPDGQAGHSSPFCTVIGRGTDRWSGARSLQLAMGLMCLHASQALRTLFNIAYRLHALLGAAWALVLENLNALDRILESPSTTTQARAPPIP